MTSGPSEDGIKYMGTQIRDRFFWVLTALALLTSFYFQYVAIKPYPQNVYYWVMSLVVLALTLKFTQSGRTLVQYIKLSKAELFKVVWPSRNDVVMTTVVVGVAAVLISLLINFLDGVLVRLLSWITG